ncbi:hypothetical protein [Streptomyces formicae]|uniref:Uncharacterized protein n=1 Tax=Streptomyces formicae TaxID=1616117 RepID=A0A291Q612_9ACTN|nr:hypothetical protein [Streptomyces formicae]ATL26946.1 hypothetical protein KY5_1928c [Streptomyces formicae]
MDAELTALAAAGATALVQQMVTDGWEGVRGRVAALFSRGSGDEEGAVAGELEEARDEVVAARDTGDVAVADDVRAEWRSRLRRRLAADPDAVAELRALLAELGPDDGPSGSVVHNSISGGVQHGQVIQAHTVGDLTIGDSRDRQGR